MSECTEAERVWLDSLRACAPDECISLGIAEQLIRVGAERDAALERAATAERAANAARAIADTAQRNAVGWQRRAEAAERELAFLRMTSPPGEST